MREYLIIRYGSNRQNQDSHRAAVAIVEAKNRDEAKTKAFAGDVKLSVQHLWSGEATLNVFNNQCIEVVTRSRARKSEWNSVCEIDSQLR